MSQRELANKENSEGSRHYAEHSNLRSPEVRSQTRTLVRRSPPETSRASQCQHVPEYSCTLPSSMQSAREARSPPAQSLRTQRGKLDLWAEGDLDDLGWLPARVRKVYVCVCMWDSQPFEKQEYTGIRMRVSHSLGRTINCVLSVLSLCVVTQPHSLCSLALLLKAETLCRCRWRGSGSVKDMGEEDWKTVRVVSRCEAEAVAVAAAEASNLP